jgi:uncharacterized protein
VVYLHGFASSAGSSKARFFSSRLAELGLTLRCPDFNEPDFRTLTISRMLEQLGRELQKEPRVPTALIGSSLGAFVALQAAARLPASARLGEAESGAIRNQVDRLVLLAPALDFSLKNDRKIGADALAKWRETDRLDVFHHGYGEMRSVGYGLYADAQQYDSFALDLHVPILIVQGRRDESVDPALVERFARSRPNVTLHLVDDDHQLLGSLELIWRETSRFLGLTK